MTITVLLAIAAAILAAHRRSRASLVAVFLALWVLPGSAFAAGGGETMQAIKLSPLTISLVVALFIPIVTGLLTKFGATAGFKGLVTLVLNAVQSLIVTGTQADGTAVLSEQTLIAFVLSLAISIATYAGVYRPLNITSSTPDGKLGAKGIG